MYRTKYYYVKIIFDLITTTISTKNLSDKSHARLSTLFVKGLK